MGRIYKLGSVAGPVIQATGTFDDGLIGRVAPVRT
jgi:hypothetical protein